MSSTLIVWECRFSNMQVLEYACLSDGRFCAMCVFISMLIVTYLNLTALLTFCLFSPFFFFPGCLSLPLCRVHRPSILALGTI